MKMIWYLELEAINCRVASQVITNISILMPSSRPKIPRDDPVGKQFVHLGLAKSMFQQNFSRVFT